jgi:hypothetical protein
VLLRNFHEKINPQQEMYKETKKDMKAEGKEDTSFNAEKKE